MQIIHNDEIFEIENNMTAINDKLQQITKAINEKNNNIVLSHLVIDGEEVFADHADYISQRIVDIETIEVITRNLKGMVWETMESMHDYLDRAIPALTELVDDSYDNFSTETWDGIADLSEGMQWILQFMGLAKLASEQPANWPEMEQSLRACEAGFAQLLRAMEAKDTIMISDLLSYEIIPAYESLNQNLALSLEDKEYLADVD